jgi:hypothetical protein
MQCLQRKVFPAAEHERGGRWGCMPEMRIKGNPENHFSLLLFEFRCGFWF